MGGHTHRFCGRQEIAQDPTTPTPLLLSRYANDLQLYPRVFQCLFGAALRFGRFGRSDPKTCPARTGRWLHVIYLLPAPASDLSRLGRQVGSRRNTMASTRFLLPFAPKRTYLWAERITLLTRPGLAYRPPSAKAALFSPETGLAPTSRHPLFVFPFIEYERIRLGGKCPRGTHRAGIPECHS